MTENTPARRTPRKSTEVATTRSRVVDVAPGVIEVHDVRPEPQNFRLMVTGLDRDIYRETIAALGYDPLPGLLASEAA